MRIVKNMGEADRLVRTVVAIGLIGVVLMGAIQGVVAMIALGLGVVFLATSAFSSCPLYTLFGISTLRIRRTG